MFLLCIASSNVIIYLKKNYQKHNPNVNISGIREDV